jgi:dissimilatory sulfite reductase (desulfoviridin) alpha/beta subunit
MLDGEFFKEKMLVKIKFAITGCPNGCAKPQANDFGVMGIIKCTSIRKSAQVAVYVLIHVRIKLLSWKVKKQALSGIGASYVVNV